tara:strand:- start:69 stop:380 length:312 start_codon:yes stop_codon:yes gene_type:complete
MLVVGCGESESVVDLKARINYRDGQFTITNNDTFDWINVKFEINKEYTIRVDRINAGEVYTVGSMQFTKSDGAKFNPFTHSPHDFFIWAKTREGKRGMWLGAL